MPSSLTYTPVDVAAIAKALTNLFEPGADGQVFTRASATNVIVSGATLETLKAVTESVEMIAPVHPARFFIPVMEAGAATMRAEVAAACVKVSNGSDVCSEIVRLYFPPEMRSAVPSVIRANMLPGLSSEVFAFGWDDSSHQLIKQSDEVYLDSLSLESKDLLRILDAVTACRVPTVDFNWVRLGMWREEMKRLFDMAAVGKFVSTVSTVVIECVGYTFGEYHSSAFTLAGWIVNRLNAEPLAFSKSGWECRTRSGGSLTVSLVSSGSLQPKGGISAVMLGASAEANSNPFLTIRRGELLESHLTLDTPVVLKRGMEKEDPAQVIERFFLVGDSTVNYEAALTCGLDMFRLTRGFAG